MNDAANQPPEASGAIDPSPHVEPERYLTADVPGIGGRLKQRPEDFLVEEMPAYEPCGEGEHIFMMIEKRELGTMELVRILAQHFGVATGAIGVAGLKDKFALTRQVVSVHAPGKKIEDFPMIRDERIGVLWTDYHRNKLRRGQLAGNRFSVRIRDVRPTDVRHALACFRILETSGVPNRLGEQRFGARANNHLIGRALVLGDARGAIDCLLGPEAGEAEPPRFRSAYASGDFATALQYTPRRLTAESAALRVLARGGDHARALKAIDRRVIEFFLSAMQSAVFNAVLDARMASGTLGELGVGDIAFKHDNGACFAVGEADLADGALRPRLDRLEISPTGPMWGGAMMRASGEVGVREVAALERFGLRTSDIEAFGRTSREMFDGVRRPLRIPLKDPDVEGGVDEHGAFVRLAFTLPRGAFATVVAREVMKSPVEDGEG